MFYGFLTLFVGNVDPGDQHRRDRAAVFGWRFFEGDFYLGYSVVLDVLGLAPCSAGILMMMAAPGRARAAARLHAGPIASRDPDQDRRAYRIGDWVFVGALLYLVLTGYAARGRADRDGRAGPRRVLPRSAG